jgi:DNA topoisomerase-1
MRLIIVESPKKARTLAGFAGVGYRVIATMGHVRDLPTKGLGLEIGQTIVPQYEVLARARRTVSEIRTAARGAEAVLLATDPDREGEAIAWHLAEAAGLPASRTSRIAFHEISDRALRAALARPRKIDVNLVDAQQARRILDRLVGYGLSPLLWRAIQSGTSGGRVQSVALRMIVDREREVRAFEPEEFWTVDVTLSTVAADDDEIEERFVARVVYIGDNPALLKSEASATVVVHALQSALFRVVDVASEGSERPPPPPFTTSTLQQAAASRYRFPAKRTMQIAQSLYESGLITYMRSDSVTVSPEAVQAVRSVIASDFGPGALSPSARQFRTRSRNAQEAHEAIRPVDPSRRPSMVSTLARGDEGRLYGLIWSRMVASQMASAQMRTVRATIEAMVDAGQTGDSPDLVTSLQLEARATTVVSPGWLAVYGVEASVASPVPSARPGTGDAEADTDTGDQPMNASLPQLTVGEVLALESVDPTQRFTRPPPRYSEASLVRALEASGIGRPSTYATILTTIQERGYVGQSNHAFVPTTLGFAVNDYLALRFPDVVDVQFTARMEERLDDVAAGELDWQSMIGEFHEGLAQAITAAAAAVTTDKMHVARSVAEATIETPGDLGAGKKASPAPRRRARAVETSPNGAATRAPVDPSAGRARPDGVPEACPSCGKPMAPRRSAFGEFWGCSGYPKCRHIHRDEGASTVPVRASGTSAGKSRRTPPRSARQRTSATADNPDVVPILGADVHPSVSNGEATTACPKCGKPMVARQSQYGAFWGCSGYPRCREIVRPDGEASSNVARPRRASSRGRDTPPDPMTARVVRGRRTYRRPGSFSPTSD